MSEPRMDDVVRALVADAPIPLVLVDLRRRVVEEVSTPMLELLAQSRHDVNGRPVTTFSMQPSQTAALLDLLVDEQLDGYQADRKLRRGDGEVLACTVWTRVLDPDRERRWALLVIDRRCDTDGVPASSIGGPTVVGVVDDRWVVTSVSTDVHALLGVSPGDATGTDIFTGIHRSDQADVLLAVASVISDGTSSCVRVRVRHADGRWIRVRLQIALLAGGPPWSYGFTMTPVSASGDGEAARLEDHLRRIALEVRAAGIARIDAAPDDVAGDLAHLLDGLTERQWDIVLRLRAGERVPDIARAMFLSPSTVRNHLSAVFARFGVHSQAELLRRLRSPKDASPIAS